MLINCFRFYFDNKKIEKFDYSLSIKIDYDMYIFVSVYVYLNKLKLFDTCLLLCPYQEQVVY
jgi:hypothetical protein